MVRVAILFSLVALSLGPIPARAADSVMVQCGREYQAARTAGTLNGLDWAHFRTECATRLKSGPAAAAAPVAPAAAAAAPSPVVSVPAAAPATAAVTAPDARPVSAGMAAKNARQKQCGAEWRAQKVALVAQTPGLTWPRYWSQCNARLKAAR